MMKILTQTSVMLVLGFCLALFLLFNNLMEIDEAEIIEASNQAIFEENFEGWVFDHRVELDQLTKMICEETELIFLNNPKVTTRITVNQMTGRPDTTLVLNKSKCRNFSIKNHIIENAKTSNSIRQKLEIFVPFLEERGLSTVRICRDRKSLSLMIPRKRRSLVSDYYVYHWIRRNDPRVDNLKVDKTFDALRKSKKISADLQYVIEIFPYNGI